MTEWIEYTHTFSFWHHITPKERLVDTGCLTDHFHLDSKWVISVQVLDNEFLDVKTVKKIVKELMDPLGAELPMDKEHLKMIADSSGKVGQAGGLVKPAHVLSINQVLKIEDASAEVLLIWLQSKVEQELLALGYFSRKVKVWFRETENYSFSVD